jgi:hypothetical protein
MEYLKAQSNELEEEVRARILKTCVEAWMNLRRVTDLEKT